MGAERYAIDGDGTSVSETSFEMSDEYRAHFRVENRQLHFASFFGVVPAAEERKLITHLGEFDGTGHMQVTLMSYTRTDLTMPSPAPGKGVGILTSPFGIFKSGMLSNRLKGLVAPPADRLLNMVMLYPGGKEEDLHYANLFIRRDCGSGRLPMTVAITLRNPNPIQAGVFAFNVSFSSAD